MRRGIEIEVQHLTHRFGKREVLHDVTFAVPAGSSVAIAGASGSGKSTLLACLMGLIDPTEGTVLLSGQDIHRLSRRDRARYRAEHLGVVFQRGELLPALSAEENVLLPGMLSGVGKEVTERSRQLLASLDVPATTLARDLSGGETQRTALARALAGDPGLVLADEPTGALDAEMRDTAADRLFGECRERGATLVLVTHDPAVAARADRRLGLHEGRLAEVAPTG